MYHCLCNTCKEDELIEELARAQEYFNEHADRGCEVEILNVDLSADQLNAKPTQSPGPGGETAAAEEPSSVDDAPPADE